MPQESISTVGHLSLLTTTPDGVTGTTVGSDPWSTITFYVQWAVIAITLVGAAANGLVLHALIATGQFKKRVLIVNQNALDLASCLIILATYITKLSRIYLTGSLGHYLCMIILSEALVWCSGSGSIINLAVITVERYLKVVHHVWSKKTLRKWMIYLAGIFSWIGGIVSSFGAVIPTTRVVDGSCFSVYFWKSPAAKMAYGIWYFLFFYVIIIMIFIYCYWRILSVIRRQARVMADHGGPGPSTAQTQSQRIQSNVIKTMIIVSAFFAVTWAPIDIYYLIMMLGSDMSLLQSGYYAALFISILYVTTNPFIYAVKFEPVRRYLLGLIHCNKVSTQPEENSISVKSRVPPPPSASAAPRPRD